MKPAVVATYCKSVSCDSAKTPLTMPRRRGDTLLRRIKSEYESSPGLILPSAFPDKCKKSMSASPVFSSAAIGRYFIFPPSSSPLSMAEKAINERSANAKKTAQILAHVGAISKLAKVVPASCIANAHAAHEMVSSGIPQLDSLTGGIPRGCLTEICGTASSGRTSVLLLALAQATRRGEVCALVDASDAFDPASAASVGMEMSRLLWVRCGEKYPLRKSRSLPALAAPDSQNLQYENLSRWKNTEAQRWESQLAQMLKVTDLLLQSNGFGMIALDLSDIPVLSARRIPLASWFRFRRAVEHTPTALLVLEQQPIAGSCSSILLRVSAAHAQRSGNWLAHSELPHSELTHSKLTHSKLLDQFEITAELLRSRVEKKLERKPAQSATTSFESRAAWAG
jgi:recombination protein RecA